jgi:hypothetical protein
MGNCSGTLRVFADRIEFDSSDRDKDDRSFTLDSLRRLKVEGAALEFAVDEKEGAALGLRDKRYRFELLDGAPDALLVEHLKARIAG